MTSLSLNTKTNQINHQPTETEVVGEDELPLEVEMDNKNLRCIESELSKVSFRECNREPDDILSDRSLRILYQTNNMLLPELVQMIRNKAIIDIRPEYQRRLRWSDTQKSSLIESLILNVPIPPIYWIEKTPATYEVVDGQQRLSAIEEFFNGKFPLKGLVYLSRLNGKRFNELSDKVKSTLNRATINTIVLLLENQQEIRSSFKKESIDLKRLIFEKLNMGGTKLNSQEIRSALYSSDFNNAIIELSRYRTFTRVFGFLPYTSSDPQKCEYRVEREKQTAYRSMRDCEIALRFFAFKDRSNIRGSQVEMLDRVLINNKTLDNASIENEKNVFKTRLDFLYELFDKKPFQITKEKGKSPIISVNLFDAFMVAINELWDHRQTIQKQKKSIQEKLRSYLKNKMTYNTLTGKVIGAKAINSRIDLAKRILYENV